MHSTRVDPPTVKQYIMAICDVQPARCRHTSAAITGSVRNPARIIEVGDALIARPDTKPEEITVTLTLLRRVHINIGRNNRIHAAVR